MVGKAVMKNRPLSTKTHAKIYKITVNSSAASGVENDPII